MSGFTVETYTAQELADLCVYILKNANDAAGKIETDETLTVSLDGKSISMKNVKGNEPARQKV